MIVRAMLGHRIYSFIHHRVVKGMALPSSQGQHGYPSALATFSWLMLVVSCLGIKTWGWEQPQKTLATLERMAIKTAEQGQWDESLKANARLWAGGTGSLSSGIDRWHLLVASGQQLEANKLAHILITRVSASKKLSDIYTVCTKLQLKPGYSQPGVFLEPARMLVSQGIESPWTQRTLAIALYRTGKFAESLTALNKSLDLQRRNPPDIPTLAFLALTHQKLNHPQDAAQWRALTEADIRRQLSLRPEDKNYPDWKKRLQFQWLHEEMQAEGIPEPACQIDEQPH